MRLSQLARKLEISPSELILFFEKNKIGSYKSQNNKIDENDLKLAFNHYKPALIETDHDEHAQPEPNVLFALHLKTSCVDVNLIKGGHGSDYRTRNK